MNGRNSQRPDSANLGTDRTFPTLNAVRAIGAIMVVATHAAFNTGEINNGWWGAVLSRFDFGVTLFFVLSGFLLSRPFLLARARGLTAPSVRHYLWKRALRILPLYWVVVVAAMLLDPKNNDASLADWISQLTLTQIYRPELLASSLTQMWSLCTEAAFYLFLPLLVALVMHDNGAELSLPRIARRSLVLAALGVAWQAAVATVPLDQGHYAQWLPGMMPWFLVGLWFAAVSASLTVAPRRHLLDRWGRDLTGCWVVGLAVFAVACTPIAGPRLLLVPTPWEAALKVVLYAIAGAFLVLPLVFGPEREGRSRRALSGPVPFWLGEVSYGIFAIHMLVLNLVFAWLDIEIFTGHFALVLSLTLAITIALAALSFHWFERPVLRLKNIRRFAALEPPRYVPTATEDAVRPPS
jgi:peptidoglycan/LPS O-acetylase OafA/YrhL